MPPRSHREEAALATSLALHAIFLLYLWLRAVPLPMGAPGHNGAGMVTFEIGDGTSARAEPIAPTVVKPNPPILFKPTQGLPKKPRHAANRRVQSEDTVSHEPLDEGTIPVIHGIDRSTHQAEKPQVEDDDDDGADSTAAADDQSDDAATERSSPAGAGLAGAGGVGAPGGMAAIWGGAIDALAGVNRFNGPDMLPKPTSDPGPMAEIHARLAARRNVCYPRALARMQITGGTKARFCVGPDGQATDVEVLESSGEPLLDKAATECVIKGAAPFPGRGHCLGLTIDFRPHH